MQHDAPSIDRLERKRLAAAAAVDERTLAKRLRGEPVRGMAGGRADRVLAERGIGPTAESALRSA